MKSISIKDFKLPNTVDRIRITKVQNGLNRFYYKDKELSLYGKIVIPVSDIKAGFLKYKVNSSIVNMKDIINRYINEGWTLDKMEGDSAYFIKEGYNSQTVYIGDINFNIIEYTYYNKGNIKGVHGNTLKVLLSTKNTNKYNDLFDIRTIEVEDSYVLDFRTIFPSVVSVKIEYLSGKYFTLPSVGTKPASELIPIRHSYFTQEVNRIISNEQKNGFVLHSIYNNFLYLMQNNKIKKVSIPQHSTQIKYRVSTDGISYSKKQSILNIVHKEIITEEPMFEELPSCKLVKKTVTINPDSIVAIPNLVIHKTIEIDA